MITALFSYTTFQNVTSLNRSGAPECNLSPGTGRLCPAS